MERGLDASIREKFGIGEQDVRTYSPLVLAYIGDAVYETIVRTIVVARGNISTNHMNNITRGYVKAESQAMMAEYLAERLTEEEESVYRRGRNAKSATVAKNASVADYRKATGFEALVGHLYLMGEDERLLDLVQDALVWYDEHKSPKPARKAKKE